VGSHSALDYLTEDDSIGVETCSPRIYGCRYYNKLLC